jgi:repressor LexA
MVPTPQALTPQQERILAFIRAHLREHGHAPTREEIAQHFGFSVRASAGEHLQALARKGHIELTPGAWRGIKLTQPLADMNTLPLVGRVAAGAPLLSAEHVESRIAVDPRLFRPRADFLFRVQGESMRDAGILDGDLVGVRQQPRAENGQIVVARIVHRRTGEDELTLKRYFHRGDKVVLEAENTEFPPIEIDFAATDPDTQERAPVSIEGLYVGLIRRA